MVECKEGYCCESLMYGQDRTQRVGIQSLRLKRCRDDGDITLDITYHVLCGSNQACLQV